MGRLIHAVWDKIGKPQCDDIHNTLLQGSALAEVSNSVIERSGSISSYAKNGYR